MTSRSKKKSPPHQSRSAARFYAVQALFQMEVSGQTVDQVCQEFETHRFGQSYDEGVSFIEGDVEYFRTLITQAVNWQSKIDQMTDRALVAKWPIDRIDPVLRAIFRCAGAELIAFKTPPKVVITEFLQIIHAFFPNSKEEKFVNAVLDYMAKEAKPTEFS